MIKYVFAEHKVVAIKNAAKANPQKIGEALEKITKRNDGQGSGLAEMLWRDAQGNPRHPAYIHFEWDVQKAAEAHWTDTARRIIAAIVPLDEKGKEMEIPAFVSCNTGGGTSYRHFTEVLGSDELQRAILEGAERDLIAFQNRYRRFKDLFDAVRPALDIVQKKIGNKKKIDA